MGEGINVPNVPPEGDDASGEKVEEQGVDLEPTPERIPTKQEVVEGLREKGLTDETRALVIRWTEIQERNVTTTRDQILLNIQRIDFYEAAKEPELALECAQEAYEHAYREGEDDICDKLSERYPGIGV